MARATRGFEAQVVVLALTTLACASAPAVSSNLGAPLSIDSVQEIEVKTSGATVTCHFVEQQFAGQVLLRTPGGKSIPGTDVQFWSFTSDGNPERLDIHTNEAGRFEAKV